MGRPSLGKVRFRRAYDPGPKSMGPRYLASRPNVFGKEWGPNPAGPDTWVFLDLSSNFFTHLGSERRGGGTLGSVA